MRWSRSTRAEEILVVARAQSGDRQALDQVLHWIQEPLFEHIRSIVGDADSAKDVLQETLWIIARRLSSLRDVRWFKAWSYRIATREAIHRTRSEKRWTEALRGEAMNELPAESDEPDFDPGLTEKLVLGIGALSPASSVVLRMRYLDGLSQTEIAEALEIPEGTVKSRLAYGLTTLRREIVSSASVE